MALSQAWRRRLLLLLLLLLLLCLADTAELRAVHMNTVTACCCTRQCERGRWRCERGRGGNDSCELEMRLAAHLRSATTGDAVMLRCVCKLHGKFDLLRLYGSY